MKGHDKKAGKSVVAVLDAGGQYVDLVQKAAERLGYPADVLPLSTPVEQLQKNYQAIIISGSPASSQAEDAPMPDPAVWQLDMPILGICYGLHAMVTALGGQVERGTTRQDGRVMTTVDTKHPLFQGTKASFSALFTHGNFVVQVPPGFEIIGQHKLSGDKTVYSAIAKERIVGVQFHPEVFDDTPEGYQVFKNFLNDIADLKPDPAYMDRKMDELAVSLRADIRAKARDRHVIAFVSGGVDSSVMAALAATEIAPDKLHAYYIDNGLMRREDDAVIDLLKALNIPVEKVQAAQDFLMPLGEVVDPQMKRRIIGKTFVDIQNRLISQLGLKEALLLQGTNAADRIESGYSKGGQHTALIKTHHNQVQEVQDLKSRGLLIEPLDELFKDEVRALGRHLGLPSELVNRQPFPGPGLAVRVLCAKGDEVSTGNSKIEKAIQTYLKTQGALEATQTHAKLLPIRNVGVGGDERSHIAAVALQSFASWEILGQLAISLPSAFRDEVNRVVVALGNQPITELSLTPTLLQPDALEQLRHADSIVHQEMRTRNLLKEITQFPVVLLPLSFGSTGKRSIVLRPLTTTAFLTVQAMIPGRDLPIDFITTTSERILAEVPGISQVFIDLTNKPPATTEWE
ncbi:MAG: gamma-glutamyl-gamma-aminobutyrate hydrolase family protein [Patescibacteria group bacterium]